jgi:S1-C subfamily serine protease
VTSLYGDGSVRLGDVIVKVNGQAVKQAEDLMAEIEEQKVGDSVTLKILRRCDPRREQNIRLRLAFQ